MTNAHRFAAEFSRDALVAVLVAAIALGPAALPAFAGPEGFDPRIGGATLNQVDATHWEITAPDGSVIQYSSFNIAMNEAVQFLQPGADARVLNRILGGSPTQIDGSLTGNGHIYIVNPAGVVFGAGATVNANGIHAAGGHLSDADFASRAEDGTIVDHYTGVTGEVTNAADIVARAVSLVGEKVVNSGQVIAQDGWIVIAAGNDVIIGRDTPTNGGRGLLLRVEGVAGAVFDAGAIGVTNTGTLEAGADGTVRVGAGDLYGTAIFSSSAIRAREIALAAGNRGDIALAGEVNAEKVDISFRGGTTAGELRSTTGGAVTTVQADELELSAADTGAEIRVSDDVAFRSQDDAAVGPNKVTLEQNATLSSSRLEAIDIGANTAATTRELALRSTAGNVVVDDKAIVADSNLTLAGTLADIQGTDALNVASLAITGATTAAGGNARSAGDLVASTGGISVKGNLELTTKPSTAGAPPEGMLVSAHQGTLDVDGNVTTSAGGALRIEARDVDLGTTVDANPNDEIPPVPVGGAITTRGDLKIGFTDSGGLEQTRTVKTRAIVTRGASQSEGGDVDIAASGDVSLGVIATNGGISGSASQPNPDGGSVSVRSTGDGARVAVGAITTGGADAAERGAIELAADTVVLTGSLNATGGSIANADHARDRAVKITADTIELDTSGLTIAGGDVDLGGAIRGADVVPATVPPSRRSVDLAVSASGDTKLRSTAELRSLSIASTGESVVLGGDVDVETSIVIGFAGSGTGTVSSAGAPVTVSANRVELAASDPSAADGRSAKVALGDGVGFDLSAIPATETEAEKPATLVLNQDAAIGSAAASQLVGATQSDSDLTLELRTNDAVSLDADARADLTGTDLVIGSESFAAIGATQTASDFDLSSLVVLTLDPLDVDFGVTAESVRLHGARAGTGDLTLRSALRADSIALAAGDGTAGAGSDARVVLGTGASLRSRANAGSRPTRVDLIQDAALDSAALPELDIFGGSIAGMTYGLQSTDNSVSLIPGTSEKYTGSALELRGQTGVNLGDEALSLASLTVETPTGLVVNQRIDATAPDGVIRLRAGSDGSGDLAIDSRLAANTIELVAGSGNGNDATARVLLDDGARFSAATGDARPANFTFEQDASIGAVSGTGPTSPVLDLDRFGGAITGMHYTLRSNGASLRVDVDDTSKVNGTTLTLEGDTGVDVDGDLVVEGFDLLGATTLSGDIASSGDVLIRSALTLDGTDAQSVSAGAGNLTAHGAIAKSGEGTVSLSGQVVDVQAVTTGHKGDSLTITGVERVKTGALDASGALGERGGDVTVSATPGASSGQVEIASINARGGAGAEPITGPDGGVVRVTGSTIAIGAVDSGGGDAASIAPGTVVLTRRGGDAGAITLDADVVTMNDSLDATGGGGSANDPNAVADLRGAAADVSVLGSILLASDAATDGANVIRGGAVVVEGGVSRAATREPGETAFAVFAESSLSFGADLSADLIDLEVRSGDLDLASGGVSEIRANTIRLTATDGNGGDTDSRVILTGLTLESEVENEEGNTEPPIALSIQQDFSIGGAGSPLPPMGGVDRTVALISHDGSIEIDGASDVADGTRLILAANGLAGSTLPAVRVSGGLDVAGLVLGDVSASGETVDGDARIDGDLVIGSGGLISRASLLDVSGEAAIEGSAAFSGTGNQALRVGAGETLALGGEATAKTTAGKLTLDADSIRLTRAGDQAIESRLGQLEIGSANGTGLVKGDFDASGSPAPASAPAGLNLRGSAAAGTGPAITVRGTRKLGGGPAADGRDYAIAVADGDLFVDARAIGASSTTPVAPATWSVEGDVLAYGDATLLGRAVLEGGRENYSLSARRAAQTSASRGGVLGIAGLASADGDVLLHAQGDVPSSEAPNPTALLLLGEFDVAQDLTLSGVTEIAGNTVLRTGGDLAIESQVHGPGSLAIESGRVLFTSADATQSVQARSLSFGSSGGASPSAQPSVFRDGDLELGATNGDVQFAPGQQLIVAGDLEVDASHAIVLADTAALSIVLDAPIIQARGGTSVVANRIGVTNRPSSVGGIANFATPTREQIGGDVAGANVLLRQISHSTVVLTQAQLVAGDFPDVNGPAYFDFAAQVPRFGRQSTIVRPRADVARLAELREDRPLWADELLFYLDARSRRAPSAREQGALPPVSAGPNATTPDTALEGADPAVEQAIEPYRELFRPDPDVDPESGIVQGEDRAPQIRAAFEHAVQVAGGARGGSSPTAAEVAAALERDPNLADARIYRADLSQLISAANRALEEDQQVRFRERLLARVAPAGMSPAEFSALIP